MPAAKKAKKPKKTPVKKTSAPQKQLPKIRSLLTDSASDLMRNPKLFWIAALVLVPSGLLSTGTTGATALGSIATILMNLALVWAIIELGHGRKVTIKEAYFRGTAAFVQFLLVALLLVLMILPLIIAFSVVGLGILPAQALLAERILLGFVALLLAAPTIYWLTRYVFALFTVCEHREGPIAALRSSGRLVKGRWFETVKRLAVIAVLMSIVASLPQIWFSFTKTLPSTMTLAVIQVVIGAIVLPYLSLYLHRVYKALDGQSQSR